MVEDEGGHFEESGPADVGRSVRMGQGATSQSILIRLYVLSQRSELIYFTKQGRGLAKPCITTNLISRLDDEMSDSSGDRREYIIKSISGTVYAGTCYSLVDESLTGGVPTFV